MRKEDQGVGRVTLSDLSLATEVPVNNGRNLGGKLIALRVKHKVGLVVGDSDFFKKVFGLE